MSDQIRSGLLKDVKELDPTMVMTAGDVKDSGGMSPDQKPGADRDSADQDADGSDSGDTDASDKADTDGSDSSDADGSDGSDADGTDNA